MQTQTLNVPLSLTEQQWLVKDALKEYGKQEKTHDINEIKFLIQVCPNFWLVLVVMEIKGSMILLL